jgi:hypothetical protein
MNDITDTQRLEFLVHHEAYVTFSRDREVTSLWRRGSEGRDDAPYFGFGANYRDWRHAIDAGVRTAASERERLEREMDEMRGARK